MTAPYDLAGFAQSLTDARDRAYARAADAEARREQVKAERAGGDQPGSVFAEIAQDQAIASARDEALAEWSANALALSSLHMYTRGDFGEPYQEQPSPFKRPATAREAVSS